MASKVAFEIQVLEVKIVPDHVFTILINNAEVSPSFVTLCGSSIDLIVNLPPDSISRTIGLIEDISEYSVSLTSSDYEGTLTISLSLCPVLSLEDPSETPLNCRYLKNISESENFSKKTRGVLTNLEEIMGPSYYKMLEDAVRTVSPARSPMKKNSKPGNKTPASTPGKSPYKRSLSGVNIDQGGTIEIPCNTEIYMDKVSGKDPHCLMLIVAALLAKRRMFKSADDEDKIIQNIMLSNGKAFEVMKAAFEETKAQMQTEKDEIWYRIQLEKDQIAETMKEKEKVDMENAGLDEELEILKKERDVCLENIELLKKISVDNCEELVDEVKRTRENTEKSEEERRKLQERYSEFLVEFKKEMAGKDIEISKKQDELNKNISEFNQKDVQLTHVVQDNNKLQSQILQITSELIIKLSLEDRCKLLSTLVQEDSAAIQSLQASLAENIKKHEILCAETEKHLEAIQLRKESLEKSTSNSNNSLESSTQESTSLQSSLDTIKASLDEIRALFHKTSQIEQHFEALQKRLVFSCENKEHAVRELKYFSDLILHLTSCYTSAHRSFLKSSNLLEQKKNEITTIYEALAELKKKYPVYFPLKQDVLDLALGNYLNSRDGGLAVPFIREGGGVYFFGTRKILVMYERLKLSVKVGGGFLPIEEFINAYSDIEVEKFMTKCQELSPKTKKFLGKWVGGLAENCENAIKLKETLVHAAEEHKYTVSYAVRSPDHSPSPLRKSRTSFN